MKPVRAAAYVALAHRPATEIFVITNALCKNAPREVKAWGHVVDLAIQRKVPLMPVVLHLSPEENYRRVQGSDRVGKKMTSAEELKSYFEIDEIQQPGVPETFVIDVANLSAEQSAEQIFANFEATRNSLRPATVKHLHFR